MLGFRTVRGKTTIAVIFILILAMSGLTAILVANQRDALMREQSARQNVMLSVLSFDLNTNFRDLGFTRSLDEGGRLISVAIPDLPEFDSHVIVDASAEQTFGLVSVLEWDAGAGAFVRITTSAVSRTGERAVGTALADPDTLQMLRAGETVTTIGRVADADYVIKLVPVLGSNGAVIGALEAGEDQRAVTAALSEMIRTAVATTLIACLGAGGLFILFVPMALRPIRQVNAAMGRIAQGDYGTTVPHLTMRDAIGDIARNLQTFAAGLSEAATARDAQLRAQTQMARATEDDARIQSRVVDEVSRGLKRLATGDLSTPIDSPAANPFPVQYDGLRESYNTALSQLGLALSQVQAAANSVQDRSGAINSAAEDLAKRAEHQAATLEQSVAALTELTASVHHASERAVRAEQVGRNSRAGAEEGAAVMAKAIAAMDVISASSQSVTRIIDVIEGIAFQTNLLALNAGVEAARAGDAGRGFAVVATEVRALARRAAESAHEIKTLISTSADQVTMGKALVHKTGGHLGDILGHAIELQEFVSEIAAGAREQSIGLDEITMGINEMDVVTQQNAALAIDVNSSASGLAQTAGSLVTTLGTFRLSDSRSHAPRSAPGDLSRRTAA